MAQLYRVTERGTVEEEQVHGKAVQAASRVHRHCKDTVTNVAHQLSAVAVQ